jgi:magnesium transporter
LLDCFDLFKNGLKMISLYYRSVQDLNLAKIEKPRKGCLIVCFEPEEGDLKFLKENLKLNDVLINDGMDPYEIPRIEKEDGLIYIFLRVPVFSLRDVFTTTLLVVISENFFLIFSKSKIDFLEKFILENKTPIITTQKTRLFIQILYEIYEQFNRLILKINKEVRKIAFETAKVEDEEIKRFIRFEIILNDFLDAFLATKVVFNSILKQEYLKLFSPDRELIENLVLKAQQLEELASANIRNIANIREGYESIFTNTVNKVLKILTFFTILLSVPTMITSFFGMNLKLPLENNPLAYFLVILVSIFSMIILFIIFKIKKWL